MIVTISRKHPGGDITIVDPSGTLAWSLPHHHPLSLVLALRRERPVRFEAAIGEQGQILLREQVEEGR